MLALLLFLLSWIFLFQSPFQGFATAPSPNSGESDQPFSLSLSPAPDSGETDPPISPSFLPETVPTPGEEDSLPTPLPEPAGGEENIPEKKPAETPVPPPEPDDAQIPAPELPGKTDSMTVKWCAVRNEFVDCQYYISLLKQTDGYSWKCVQRETVEECLNAIKHGEFDLINLDAGLAFIAFLNYSMKAIANEVYCNHAQGYNSVAVVNRKACDGSVGLKHFKGQRSCHGGYGTAVGWNYPINYLKKIQDSEQGNDLEIVTGFFSETCAPSEFEGKGECGGCGSHNGSCLANDLYSGHAGAFRCLVEDLGDIAFVRADTPILYSMEGPNNHSWSTKSVHEFMYLCPQGGCREINGYPGACKFGTVPANTIMAHNSISNKKRSIILQTLLNATWSDALYTGKNGASHLLSTSTQGLAVVKKLTRSYLGASASISQTIHDLNFNQVQATNFTTSLVSGAFLAAMPQHLWVTAIFSFLLGV